MEAAIVIIVFIALLCFIVPGIEARRPQEYQPRIQRVTDSIPPRGGSVTSAPPSTSLDEEKYNAFLKWLYIGECDSKRPIKAWDNADTWSPACGLTTEELKYTPIYRGLRLADIDTLKEAIRGYSPHAWNDISNQQDKPLLRGMSENQVDMLIDAANESSKVILSLFEKDFPLLKILKPTNPLLNRPQNPDLDITIRRH